VINETTSFFKPVILCRPIVIEPCSSEEKYAANVSETSPYLDPFLEVLNVNVVVDVPHLVF